MNASIIVWTVSVRVGGTWQKAGKGLVTMIPARIDVLDHESGFKSIARLLLPNVSVVPNGLLVTGYTETKKPSDNGSMLRQVEWMLTIEDEETDV